MTEILCENCKKLFSGRKNRRTCSLRCRSTIAAKRKFWDRKFGYVKYCELQAGWDSLTAEQREHWQKEADEAREKLIKVYGNRP